MSDNSGQDPSEETGWKILAMFGCGAAATTWLLAVASVFGSREHQGSVLTLLGMVVVGNLLAFALGIAALIGNRKDRSTRRWALLSLACALISPVSFLIALGSSL